jgi:pimeloyl-ACP methyl ester carboxylesterase
MAISHWADPERRSAYQAAYAASLSLWPTRYEERYLETPFGTTHVVASGNGPGEAIVLLHAASLGATQWYPQASGLAAEHPIFAVDIMGDIGLSTQIRPIHTRVDASEWLTGVLDRLGLEHPILIGSSFGGFLSTNLAVDRPHRVGGLVLLAPAATLKPFRLVANLMIRSGSLVPMPFTVKPGLRGMMDGDLPDERIVHQMEVGVAGFRYDRRGIYPSEIPDTELSSIGCPILVILGDHEKIYDPRAAVVRTRRLIPNAEIELIPGAGHLPGLQVPDIVNRRIRRFLEARYPTRVPATGPADEPILAGVIA